MFELFSAPILRALLVFASFSGLCALIRVRFEIDRFLAPFVAASSIIVLLMCAGMLQLLRPCLLATYALGFLGLIYSYLLKRSRPQWFLILAGLLLLAYLTWHFYPCYLWHPDDFTHWGLVVRNLLARDHFIGAGDSFVLHQSYPPGAACFVYYAVREIGNADGLCLIAQNFLNAVLLLPVFSVVQRKKRLLYPAAAAVFVVFFSFNLSYSMLVDVLLTSWGIGMGAAAVRYRNDFRRACIAVIPGAIAIAYVKSSGLFFSVCSGFMLTAIASRCGLRFRRRNMRFAPVAAPVLAYFVWSLYIRLHVPTASSSKHAISPLNYARSLYHKGFSGVLQIAKSMFSYFFHARPTQSASLVLALFCLAIFLLCARRFQPDFRRGYLRSFAACVASYLAWFTLLFFMYLFSMPDAEAAVLACIERYDATGFSYASGLIVLLTLDAFDRSEQPLLGSKASAGLSMLIPALVCALFLWPGHFVSPSDFYVRNLTCDATRVALEKVHKALPANGNYLVYATENTLLVSRFELESRNVICLYDDPDTPGSFGACKSTTSYRSLDGLQEFLSEYMDQADALIVLNESPEFEAQLSAFMDRYTGSVPIYRPTA